MHAVIHSTDYKNNSRDDSVLTERWYLEYNKNKEAVLRIVPIHSIIDSVYVMQQIPGYLPVIEKEKKSKEDKLVILVKKKETWAKYFS